MSFNEERQDGASQSSQSHYVRYKRFKFLVDVRGIEESLFNVNINNCKKLSLR